MPRNVNYMDERIQPWFTLHMPSGGVVEWPLGIFLMESPGRVVNKPIIRREIGAYDKSIIIDQDRFTRRMFFEAGANIVGAIIRILNEAGLSKVSITESPLTLLNAREYPIGMKKIHAINDLLGSINYTSIRADENGFMRAEPYIEPARRPVTKKYSTDKHSIVDPEVSERLDIAGRANVFTRVSINLEAGTEMSATVINDDPLSPISTVNRGRQIVNYEELHDIASQEVLDNHVRRIAVESTSAFSHLTFTTANMPNHGSTETLLCDFPVVFDNPQKWSETSWDMELKYDGIMRHEARRVIRL